MGSLPRVMGTLPTLTEILAAQSNRDIDHSDGDTTQGDGVTV